MSPVETDSRHPAIWPTEIRLDKDRQHVTVDFDDGSCFRIAAELLRVLSPSAEVRGHSEADRKTVGGKRNVTIMSIEAVGNYAIRICFDDMHSTGIYTWPFLADLGANQSTHMQKYLDELAAKGLSRDISGQR